MPGNRSLVRSDDQWIAGVCGGLAEYFGWPVGKVRIGYLLLSVLSAAFPGIAVYIVLWILMPAPTAESPAGDSGIGRY
jgi:phage shock protein C